MLRVFTAIIWPLLALCSSRAVGGDLVIVPDDRGSDLRVFTHDQHVLEGSTALQRMQDPDVLVVWVAGNQFFAMESVVRAFQKRHGAIDVGVVTLPPGLLLRAVQGGGLTYQGQSYRRLPDVYGSVTTQHLRQTGRVRSYVTYLHNSLELLVPGGNPQAVTSLHDLVRPDLRIVLPNPVNEGIMQIYAKPILQRLGLWTALSPGEDCLNCDPSPHVHFTSVHHREIPQRIRAGVSDVGLVWRTEGIEARAQGGLDRVVLPEDQSAIQDAVYVAGLLDGSAQQERAHAFLAFLVSPEGQAAYTAFGFLPASDEERHIRTLAPE
jgi:ABC-type molybdate transport system substrate-binding protein